MAWENLEYEILQDLACWAALSLEAQRYEVWAAQSFLFVKVGGKIKRNRPEELLARLEEITASRPSGPWRTTELLKQLGWTVDRGAQVSVGLAMTKLGWRKPARCGNSVRGKRETEQRYVK